MEPEKKSNGALIGLVVIVIILAVGGIYMWKTSKSTMVETPAQSTFTNQDTVELNSLEQSSQSTDNNTGVDATTVY